MPRRFDLNEISALEHNLTELTGDLSRFGVKLPLPKGIIADAAKIVLTIAGADGKVSSAERQALVDILRGYGAPPDEIAEAQKFQPGTLKVADIAARPPPFLRSLVYDGIRVARVDGFHDKERAATQKIVRDLKLEDGFVASVEALLRIEDAILTSRNRLLDPPGQLPEGWGVDRASTGVEARGREFGPAGMIALPREFHLAMQKAVFAIASGDGDLSDEELRWFAGFSATMGTPRDVLEEALKVDYQSAPASAVFDQRLRPYGAVAVFSALKGARADGIDPKERKLAEKGAAQFGLDRTFVTAVLNQLDVEAAVRESRIQLLAPL